MSAFSFPATHVRLAVAAFAVATPLTFGHLAAFATTVSQEDMFGAIATSGDAYGFSYDYASREEAEDAAIANCPADDCATQISFRNACGAVVRGEGRVAWGVGVSREDAVDNALFECGEECELLVWACTTPP